MAEISLLKLLSLFRSSELPKEQWTHRAHIRVALAYLREYAPPVSLGLLREAIQRLNLEHGVLTTPESGYHETRTRVWLAVLAHELARSGADPEEIVERYCRRDVVLDYYRKETLESWQARIGWVSPDLKPLALDPSGWGEERPQLISLKPE